MSTPTPQNDRADLLAQVQKAIDAERNNNQKWRPLYEWFEDRFPGAINRGDVAGKLLTEDRQRGNRMAELARSDPNYVVFTTLHGVDLDAVRRDLAQTDLPNARATLIIEEQTPVDLEFYTAPDAVMSALAAAVPELTPRSIAQPGSSAPGGAIAAATGVVSKAMVVVPLAINDRVRRMVELAILSTPAVILVGPPGTGKTQLLREVLQKIEADPAAFGFVSTQFNAPKWTTPEESWTTRELVGGETVDEEQRLRFRPGHLLDAIAENRWLVLDESNRADMDKIFGPVLTWLSTTRPDETVELGRVGTDLDAPLVTLGWSDEPESHTERLEILEADDPAGDPVRFLAGSEWRLLGTYNALDALRVFRFGEALGRRFARVPIPAPDPDAFEESLKQQVSDLGGFEDQVVASVAGLYRAHMEDAATELGPALFVKIPDYVRSGAARGTGVDATFVRELIAEAYVVSVGTWLARLEPDDLEALGGRIQDGGALTQADWEWLTPLLPALG
jgi:hypothetical protein